MIGMLILVAIVLGLAWLIWHLLAWAWPVLLALLALLLAGTIAVGIILLLHDGYRAALASVRDHARRWRQGRT